MSEAQKFRTAFKVAKETINWYPGHMKHSYEHMQAKMRSVDCIVEVHDSRIPFSGRNPVFVKSLRGTKPYILVLSKMDLIDSNSRDIIVSKYHEKDENNIVFVNSLDQKCKGLKKIVPLAINLIKESDRIPQLNLKYKMMVVGIPNVGKSSLINALRNINIHRGKATPVGGIPGVTRSVLNEIKIFNDPPLYLIDTPGIFLPHITNVETGMKLALCSCLKDELVGIKVVADFLLYWFNKTGNFSYVDHFNLKEPLDDILPLLLKIANDFGKTKKIKNIVDNKIMSIPNLEYAAYHLVKLFRKGEFGDINLDQL